MHIVFCQLIITIILFSFPNALAQTLPPGNYLMAAMGDSISAATLATLSLPINGGQGTGTPFPHKEDNFFSDNKNSLSWVSGKYVDSHFLKLTRWLAANRPGVQLSVFNASIPGATTLSLPAQADLIVSAVRTGAYRGLLYVTLMIGANDACDDVSFEGTPPDQMKASLRSALSKLAQIQSERGQNFPIRVLISGSPRVPNVGAPVIRHWKTYLGLTCIDMQDRFFKYCGKMKHWSTPDEYWNLVSVVMRKNEIIQQAAVEFAGLTQRVQLVYTQAVFDQPVTGFELAIDCFHPNRRGQQKISDVLWLQHPWFK